MVARIAEGDTTQWEVTEWVWEQAQYMKPTEHHVLLYLCAHAFYQSDNPEKGEVGQVLRKASYVESMVRGTGLHPNTIRRALVTLQRAAYIQRGERNDPNLYGQQPHVIYIIWEADDLREKLRMGTRVPPEEFLLIPTRPPKKEPVRPVLTVIQGSPQE